MERCDLLARLTPEETVVPPRRPLTKKGEISMKNVFAKYRPELPDVLKGLSCEIKPSEKIGVVGRTGAGKSTLLTTLLRTLKVNAGTIMIHGEDASTLSLEQLRQSITIVPQDPVLFEGSLRENLDVFNTMQDKTLWKCLKKVGLAKKFKDQDGLNSKIASLGSNLSAGERQLICLARAILSPNKIILFDEATSSIDVETEDKILKIIQKEFHDKTIITIAHRLKTIMASDRVFVVDDGVIGEAAAPAELLENKSGHFYKLWEKYNKATAESDA
jgi:ABC-type multidrug transport system fused ATPase/permease subunit